MPGRIGNMASLQCRECGMSLQTVDEVLQHLESAHPRSMPNPSGEYLCPGCPATFRQILQLQRHLGEAHGL